MDDSLRGQAQREKDDCLGQIEERFNSLPKVKDLTPHRAMARCRRARAKNMLSSPEQNMRIVGEAHKSAMDAIEAHVVRVHDLSADAHEQCEERGRTRKYGRCSRCGHQSSGSEAWQG
jgi:hypothetical protein